MWSGSKSVRSCWQMCIQLTALSSDSELEETQSNKKLKVWIFATQLALFLWAGLQTDNTWEGRTRLQQTAEKTCLLEVYIYPDI